MQDVEQSVTEWIVDLRRGQSEAAQKLWEAYFQRMVDLARGKLEGAARVAADEEDVALSAFKSFCLRARDGQFTQLTDRENLWPLLMAITANKSVDLIRRHNARKRGGAGGGDRDSHAWQQHPLSEIISTSPDPQFTAQLTEQLDTLLHLLAETDDADLHRIALQKLEGFSNQEIAAELHCTRRTVERKLRLIGSLWAESRSGSAE